MLLCILRSLPSCHGEEMVRLAIRYRDLPCGVIGIDVAGDEGNYPLRLHTSALRMAREEGLPVTVHAGEWGAAAEMQDSLSLALELGTRRIGHGLALASHPKLRQLVKERQVNHIATIDAKRGYRVGG